MNKYAYCLSILFDLADDGLLYSGISFYRKNLIDHLEIHENSIKLFFTRTKEFSVSDCLYVATAPTHFEIQRALTFYLAVMGRIPEVRSISLKMGEEEENLSDMSYTVHWSKCRVQITYEPEVANRIFFEGGRWPYIVMTYFLKAQLAPFAIDKFHAAWSCVNAYYNRFSKPDEFREKDKISRMENEIRNRRFPVVEKRMKELEKTDFWDKIQWYNFVQRNNNAENGQKPKLQKWLYDDARYTDQLLFAHLTKYVQNPDYSREKQKAFVSKKIGKYKKKYNFQIAWLVCEYCYMLRNRGVHADKPFPLFSLSDIGESKSIETILSEIILLTVYELMKN